MAHFIGLSVIGMVAGYILDVLFGDPYISWHPVRLIGMLISKYEKILYKGSDSKKLRCMGRLLVCLVTATVFICVELIRGISYVIHPVLFVVAEAVLIWFGLAQTSLKKESMKVYDAFAENNTEKARHAVSMIVGRDTAKLDEAGIMRAAVETVAENTSDGVTAPLFYAAFFGAAGEYVYKAVNTMDSMVGYKNDRYIDFGRCAAKLDDVFNYIPSRISALLMIAASCILGMDYNNAYRIFKRDRFKHASPNSAQTESVCAGALGLKLAGDAWYGGVLFKKDYIGDEVKKIDREDIKRACKLMNVTGAESFILAVIARCVIIVLFMSA